MNTNGVYRLNHQEKRQSSWTHSSSPLLPLLVVLARVAKPHVEVGREDEGEEGDGGGADQVKDVAEGGDGLGHEQKR